MLMALVCGLAIMLAGAVFFVQLARQDDPDVPLALGASAVVGDMTVSVDGATETDGELVVAITLRGTADDAPDDDFRLIASGRPVPVFASTCTATAGDVAETCTVTFDVSTADGVSRVLFYERGEDRARWAVGG